MFIWSDKNAILKVFRIDWELQHGGQISQPAEILLELPEEWHTYKLKTSHMFHEDALASQLVMWVGTYRDSDRSRKDGLILLNHIDKTMHGFFKFTEAVGEIIFDTNHLLSCLIDEKENSCIIRLWKISQDLKS